MVTDRSWSDRRSFIGPISPAHDQWYPMAAFPEVEFIASQATGTVVIKRRVEFSQGTVVTSAATPKF